MCRQFERFLNNSDEIIARLDELYDLMSQSRVADDLSAAETMLRRHQTQHDDISETPAGVLTQGRRAHTQQCTVSFVILSTAHDAVLLGCIVSGPSSFHNNCKSQQVFSPTDMVEPTNDRRQDSKTLSCPKKTPPHLNHKDQYAKIVEAIDIV